MRVQCLYDQGTATIIEDGLVLCPPRFFGVTDGTSGVYLPQDGPQMFGRMSGGQLASASIVNAVSAVTSSGTAHESGIRNMLLSANNVLNKRLSDSGVDCSRSDICPAASFILAELKEDVVHLIQGGDSQAIWQMQDGSVGATPNPLYEYEKFLLGKIRELIQECEGDRNKMWEKFRPILMEVRQANINTDEGGFGLLNGQSAFPRFWNEFQIELGQIARLILFSDGLVQSSRTNNMQELAVEMFATYDENELRGILAETRRIMLEESETSHETLPEVTAIVIEF